MLWKIYFWAYLVINVFGIFALLKFSPLGLIDIIGVLLSVVLFLGLYSYVFKKKILDGKTWKILFWVVIFLLAEEILEIYVLPKDFLQNAFPILKSSLPIDKGESLFSWLISVPAVYSMYKLSSQK